MKGPFKRSYWVEPGRLLAGYYPGDKSPAERDRKLQDLLDCGVTRIINLMEPNEADHSRKPFEAYEPRFRELARGRGLSVECKRFPIVDRSVPSEAVLTTILDALAAALMNQETIYVHCWGGRGRTGTVIGCHLRRSRKLTGKEALAVLSDLTKHSPAFGIVPEMPEQRVFVEQWNS
jgi:protein tyrosine phosphatase